MDWLTLVSTAVGGAVALLGSVIAHWLRSRDERSRSVRTDRKHGYVEYLIALDAAHARLRQIADPDSPPEDIPVHARRAFGESGVYGIPYRCLLPAGLEGLLMAGRCFSATHDAHASARSMATCMAMGQAAGTAAAMAAAEGSTPRAVAAQALRVRLLSDGALLEPVPAGVAVG